MNAYDRIYFVQPDANGWLVSEGEATLTTTSSQSEAIKWAAMAAMTAQARGFTATFRMAA